MSGFFADPQILSHSFDESQISSLRISRPLLLSHILHHHCRKTSLNITGMFIVLKTLEFGFLLQLRFNFQTPKI